MSDSGKIIALPMSGLGQLQTFPALSRMSVVGGIAEVDQRASGVERKAKTLGWDGRPHRPELEGPLTNS